MKEFFRRNKKSFTPSDRKSDTQIPDNLWVKCSACRELIYQKQLIDNLKVCPKCNYHMRLKAREWIGLFDANSFEEFDHGLTSGDPLNFVSPKDNYKQRLVESRELLGVCDALISGQASIEGAPLQVTITEFDFIGGSMGSVFGEKLARSVERAVDNHTPLLTINASGGARQHEGIFSLMQMAKVNMALSRLSSAGLPHFSLLVDPCYAGVIASYASVADLILAEPGARIGFAGRRVIEQTIRQKLPANYQTAEFFLERGMIDMIVARGDLRKTLTRLIQLHMVPLDQKLKGDGEQARQNGAVVVKSAS
ncbi:MAG: acetyl-CoA carboxylase carboxyltransferase subunit beta [Chloroflexi bacterium AL-W]|nr:acetyl-CoA carboxylase carboxyltransferase subunit beta [Chloroflexi bacterium AL-N1]NOK67022.1 acetyl-CoA carboxylase carboxyltransferase subunit beta [Chloroflexi bacterium AL-N10]NOK74686.1 acetyl-CoA carboxylase carboxyltransferase subunit beta [Chloroflexi bacterium AL-N5]NOK81624.1 acetyl-CoA carboxylase carboxyltransferase subunit beta [Chloroflexi bacterium AL-W]NOK89094.1 acetyl-CoA carboxylase carboxyltransferase subunit beta [Chloroflexi bacterium AL-N15]